MYGTVGNVLNAVCVSYLLSEVAIFATYFVVTGYRLLDITQDEITLF